MVGTVGFLQTRNLIRCGMSFTSSTTMNRNWFPPLPLYDVKGHAQGEVLAASATLEIGRSPAPQMGGEEIDAGIRMAVMVREISPIALDESYDNEPCSPLLRGSARSGGGKKWTLANDVYSWGL